jgi:hypothetical protein
VTNQKLAQRPSSLDGVVLGLLDNNKPGSEAFLRHAASLLGQRYELRDVVWAKKDDPTRFAPPEVLSALGSKVEVVIAAIGD